MLFFEKQNQWYLGNCLKRYIEKRLQFQLVQDGGLNHQEYLLVWRRPGYSLWLVTVTGCYKMMLWNRLFGCILLHISFSHSTSFLTGCCSFCLNKWLCWVYLFGKDVLFWTKARSSTGSQQSSACGEDRLGRCCGFSEPTSRKFSSFRMVGRFIDNCTKYDPHTYHVGRIIFEWWCFQIMYHHPYLLDMAGTFGLAGWWCFFQVLYPAETNAHYSFVFFRGGMYWFHLKKDSIWTWPVVISWQLSSRPITAGWSPFPCKTNRITEVSPKCLLNIRV